MKKFILLLCLLFNFELTLAVDYECFDVNNINSIKKATKAFKNEFKNKKGSLEAEEDFNEFLKFYDEFESVQSRNIHLPYKMINNSILLQLENYSKKYYKYGLVAQFDEGEYMLVKSNKYIYENFSIYLPKPLQEYLKYNNSDKRIISDGRYIISKKELKKQIEFYKNFIKKYPNYAKKYKITDKIKYLQEDLKHYPNIIY